MKILIADDEKLARLSLNSMLNELYPEQHEYAYASNGAETVSQCRLFKPNIIFLDIKMPQMTGLEAMEEIRKENSDAVIIILSGYSDFEYARQALKFGASGYLLKPAKLDELHKTTDQAIQEVMDKIKSRIRKFNSEIGPLINNGTILSDPEICVKDGMTYQMFMILEDPCLTPSSADSRDGKSSIYSRISEDFSLDPNSSNLFSLFYLASGRPILATKTNEPMAKNAYLRGLLKEYNAGLQEITSILSFESDDVERLKTVRSRCEDLSP